MNTLFLLMIYVPLFDMFPWPPRGLDSCPLSCSPFEQGWLEVHQPGDNIVMHAWKVTVVSIKITSIMNYLMLM